MTLKAEGHTTLEAADGGEALQILARETVDAVISDILMPNMGKLNIHDIAGLTRYAIAEGIIESNDRRIID